MRPGSPRSGAGTLRHDPTRAPCRPRPYLPTRSASRSCMGRAACRKSEASGRFYRARSPFSRSGPPSQGNRRAWSGQPEGCVSVTNGSSHAGRVSFLCAGREMPLREGATRASLQVALEASYCRCVRELQRDDERPGPMVAGHASTDPVVPLEASFDVTRDADVVTIGVRAAAEDVDETPGCHGRKQGRNDAWGPARDRAGNSKLGA